MDDSWVPPEAIKKDWVPPESARKSLSEAADESDGSVGQQALRAAAPTIRGVGPYAGGAAAGAVIGSVIPGAGTTAGGAAGATAVGLTDLAISAYNPIAKMTGMPKAPTINEVVQKALTKAGVPEVNDAGGRIIQSMASGMAGAAGQAGAAATMAKSTSGTTRSVLEELAKRPGMQAVSGATAGAAGQTTAELGGGPFAQFMASLAGGMAPNIAAGAGRTLTGQSSTPEATARLSEARAVGTKPEPSTVAPSWMNRQLAKVLGSTEEMQKLRTENVKALDKEADRIATSIGEVTNPNEAGKRLEAALGKDGFSKRAGAVESTLWDKWWGHTEKSNQKSMGMSNTLEYLQNSLRTREGAENVSELLKDKQLASVFQKLQADTGPQASKIVDSSGKPLAKPATGAVPYEVIKELRSLIGEKLDPSNLTPDVSRKALSGLYGALSTDIKSYAKQLGPEAEKDFNRANTFTRAKNERIETYLQDTQGKKSYQVWRYATSPDAVKDGGDQFMALNKSLDPAARDTFHATFIKQMGKNAQGDFDPVVFRDKYKSLSSNVKSALLPEQQRHAMDRLMRVIDSMEKGKTLQGQSGGESSMGAYMIAGAILHAHPASLLTVALASGKSEQIAKLLTSEAVVNHIAGVNHVAPSQAATALNSFIQSVKTIQPEDE